MGVTELAIVVVVLVVLAVAVAAAIRVAPVERRHRAVVDAAPDAWLDELAMTAGDLPDHRLVAAGPSSMSITRSYVPVWAVVVAVVLFPFGLLALLVRRERTGTVSARPRGDGRTDVSIAGWFDPRLIARVNRLL
jgi:hypothetical protein